MKKILRRLKRCGRLLYNFIFKNKSRLLTVRIIMLSAWYRMRIKYVPMSKLQNSFGETGRQSPEQETDEIMRVAGFVGARVERVCAKTPWESKCFVRALTAQNILARKSVHTTLYLGLTKENGQMAAHAWLRCGTRYVTGWAGYAGHVVVSYFYK